MECDTGFVRISSITGDCRVMAAEDPSRKSGCTIDGAGHRSIVHGTAGLLETLKDRRTSALVRSDSRFS